MGTEQLEKQTTNNVREKAALIWGIADQLRGEYKPHEYGKVILPMTVIKRFDDSLSKTKNEVLLMAAELDQRGVSGVARDAILKKIAGRDFYNISKFDFQKLLSDPDNVAANFIDYLQGYSDNVKDIISYFEFDKEIAKMSQNDLLYTIIQEFNKKNADMSPEHVTSQDMGYVFEELIRRFSESYDEQAGAHFTARDIIYLMTELLIAPERKDIKEKGCTKTAYDMAMGTSQMLACLDERLKAINQKAELKCFGQEFNPETFAIAKADMLIKGGDADNMKFGDTLSNDQFKDYQFDYIISNPPFGIEWKKEQASVEAESKLGFEGRFGPGLPTVGDGQLLFLLNGVKKLKQTGRMAIIQNGSSLFSGDAGSGPSEIRRYIIENDLLDAIIQLPTDLFYNTGIATYVWLLCPSRGNRSGKIQLIDASQCYKKRRKNIGSKRVDLDDNCISLIMDSYNSFSTGTISKKVRMNGLEKDISVDSKILDNAFFGYTQVTVESPKIDFLGHPILKKGKPLADPALRTTENIPLSENVDSYFQRVVKPYKPDSWIDTSKTKIGYEVPFARMFYKFEIPEKEDILLAKIEELFKEEVQIMGAIKHE